MVLEIRVVSRKTPGDGKLEITESSARRLRVRQGPLQLRLGDATDVAAVTTMTCTCAKGDGAGHEHHFVASALLKSLTPDQTVVLELLDDGEVVVSTPHPL